MVYALFQQADRLLDEYLVNARMAGGSYAVYSVIGAEEPVTPTRLAEILGMPPTSLSYQIRQMHERGHLRRVPNPADGRSVLLKLTPKGRRIVADARVGFVTAIEAFRRELEEGMLASATLPDGSAEVVRKLPLDADLVVMRRPIAGG